MICPNKCSVCRAFGSAESHYDSMTVTASALALLVAPSVEIEKQSDVNRHEIVVSIADGSREPVH